MNETVTDKNLIDAYPDPTVLLDQHGEILVTNRAWDSLSPGPSIPEYPMNGENYFEYLSQFAEKGNDAALKLILGLRKVLDGKQNHISAILPGSPDNHNRFCYKITVSVIEGERPQFLLVQEDVTNAIKTSKELKESRERYRQQFHHSIIGILLARLDGNILEANPAAVRLLGYEPGEFLQMEMDTLLVPGSEVNRAALEHRDLHGQFQGQMVLEHKHGDSVQVEMTSKVYRNEQGELHVICMFRDISEQLQTVQEQQIAYELANQLFRNAPVGIIRVGSDEKIQEVNESFCRIFGYQPEEAVGNRACDLLTPDEFKNEANQITKNAYEGIPTQQKTIRYSKQGVAVPVLLDTVPVTVNGEVVSVYGMYIDMREQEEMERQIQELYEKEIQTRKESERANERLAVSLKEKEVLLQEVHHRVKNNLAVIAGLMDLQTMESTDEGLNRKLKQVQNRIYSIANVHESIYQQEDVIGVDLDAYLEKMVEHLERVNGQPFPIRLSLEPVKLNLNQAVSCGLLINEIISLIQNSIAPDDDTGLEILLTMEDDMITLQFQNQSRLITPDLLDSFEGKIIQVLTQQLDASREFITGDRNRLSIRFRKTNVKGSSSILYL